MLEEVVLEVVETSAILAASMEGFSKSISRNTAGSKILSSSNFRLERNALWDGKRDWSFGIFLFKH